MRLTCHNEQIIFEYAYLMEQVKMRFVSSYFYENFLITNLGKRYDVKLTDESVMLFSNLKKLSISAYRFDGDGNIVTNLDYDQSMIYPEITDKGLQNLNLEILEIIWNDNITDNGIKHMNLKHLMSNQNITDEGIKNMNLDILFLNNNNITNEGIKHMNLKTLTLGCFSNITDDAIKNMKLKNLTLFDTNNITNDGIKNMNLCSLTLSDNETITYEGIKHMDLQFLQVYNISDSNITYEDVKDMNLIECKID